MLPYSRQLKNNSRELRIHMTDAEQKLWYRLRRKQINGWQFYRQKPMGSYIVDFYCPAAKLIVELDGSQHFEPEHQAADQKRDAYLAGLGLRVLRFDNRQVLLEMDAVLGVIAGIYTVTPEIPPSPPEIPPTPPFSKWGDNQRTHGEPVSVQKLTVPVVHSEPSLPTEPVPSFEKDTATSIPPFEKGGLGGICSGSPTAGEVEP
jgi:very-short-patch-repair endonuclease